MKYRKLTEAQKRRLKTHKVHHTKKHMEMMKRMMRHGSSFAKAHKKAMSTVGK